MPARLQRDRRGESPSGALEGPRRPGPLAMTLPRCLTVDSAVGGLYHCHSRCVRRLDLVAQEDRRTILIARLEHLAAIFAIDVVEFAVLDNHFHLILRTHPELAWAWSADEVAMRWLWLRGRLHAADGSVRRGVVAELAADAPRIDMLRRRLADLGWFHKELKEPCSRAWNKEDDVTGHFWQGRYGSVPAGTDASLVLQAVYVLLNRVRCGAERSLGESRWTSLGRRVEQLVREIKEGGHQDALAGFDDRIGRSAWTPVFPCDPGSVRDLDDSEFDRRVAEGRQRHAVRAALAKEGKVLMRLAEDAPTEAIEPLVAPAGGSTSGRPTLPPWLPRHHLRQRPSAGSAPEPRPSAAAWLTSLRNPFHRTRTGLVGALALVAGLPFSLLIRLADAEGRIARPDKPCRLDESAPEALAALRRRVVGSAPEPEAESLHGPLMPKSLAEPHRRLAEMVNAVLGRHRELLEKWVTKRTGTAPLRVPWRRLMREAVTLGGPTAPP